MGSIYQHIVHSISDKKRLLAVLIDPDKVALNQLKSLVQSINSSIANYIFVGGSTVNAHDCDAVVSEIKKDTALPVVLFPGDVTQLTDTADGLLFLSLISGRNPDYLIDKQVQAASKLRDMQLEVIPTGYILIENGKESSVERVTNTKPMPRASVQNIVDTALAGQLLGMKLVYLEAGSGAKTPISSEIIRKVKAELTVPLIVGGGIRSVEQMEMAYHAGADLIVIGTAFEEDTSFFDRITQC